MRKSPQNTLCWEETQRIVKNKKARGQQLESESEILSVMDTGEYNSEVCVE
jgi:hypothetical protein